ncbi:MAG: hypothetical protein LBD11_05515 [Candidatus Peribacteria bacterium]|jgi:hypothetical protein|nr:hypothetical protein [Candidatus Peribacteria bacterium]
MKKILLYLLIVLCIVALGVGYYVWKYTANSMEVIPSVDPVLVDTGIGKTSFPVAPTFEDDFYQDLSDFFGNNQGYENIQGEYGFTANE